MARFSNAVKMYTLCNKSVKSVAFREGHAYNVTTGRAR